MNSARSVEPLLVTPREAAVLLSISERKLWELAAHGDIKRVKVGRSVRYELSELRRFVEASGGAFRPRGTTLTE